MCLLHVFPFSERENTLAADMKAKIDLDIRYARAKILRRLSKIKFEKVQTDNINHIRPVLFELNEDGFVSGLTDNYIRVKVPNGNISKTNFISNVKMTEKDNEIMLGEFVK